MASKNLISNYSDTRFLITTLVIIVNDKQKSFSLKSIKKSKYTLSPQLSFSHDVRGKEIRTSQSVDSALTVLSQEVITFSLRGAVQTFCAHPSSDKLSQASALN